MIARVWSLPVGILVAILFMVTGARALPSPDDVGNAVTELDTERARLLLKQVPGGGPGVDYQRARLAIYVGDCDSADAILDAIEDEHAANLGALARSCARATAGGLVIEDPIAGVWIRLQDHGDRALVPDLIRVAIAARQTMLADLGVDLPRPLRIDLVRDLFSLAAVSGLPLEAAETTGTVAVARWGRVTMLSPRAARHGYPWEDTLAHEITHLALSRGSRDFAPLWLQEGIAKREETRWREPRPFDRRRDADEVARRALLEGNSVGIDQIGPSIAMLPSAQAAAISYAEVQSFMDYWIRTNGRAALTLLLTDLKGLQAREIDEVMLGITGYPLRYWIAGWQKFLRSLPDASARDAGAELSVRQEVRLIDLLADRGHYEPSLRYANVGTTKAPTQPAVQFRRAAIQLRLSGDAQEVSAGFGDVNALAGWDGQWLGLHGRLLREVGERARAEAQFRLAIAVDPYAEHAACEGVGAPFDALDARTLPEDPTRRALCVEARGLLEH
jgi:hypothetical protein